MLQVLTLPNPILRNRSSELDLLTLKEKKQQALIDALIKTMHDDDGIGIAAPQVGASIRMIVVGKEALKETKNPKQFLPADMVLINPSLTGHGRKTGWMQEGCLSVPGVFGDVERFIEIQVQGLDRFGNALSFDATDFFARVLQHEIDHLDGILFVDKAKNIVHATNQKQRSAI